MKNIYNKLCDQHSRPSESIIKQLAERSGSIEDQRTGSIVVAVFHYKIMICIVQMAYFTNNILLVYTIDFTPHFEESKMYWSSSFKKRRCYMATNII